MSVANCLGFAIAGLLCLGAISCARSPVRAPEWGAEAREERLARAEAFGDYYVGRMTVFLEESPRRETRGTVFLGDSITERFPVEEAFPGRNVINRGIGGDGMLGVMDRLDVSVEELDPREIHLLIGSNDAVWSSLSVDALEARYEELLVGLREAAPRSRLIVYSILPKTGRWGEYNERSMAFNERIAPLAERFGGRYVDMWPRMAGPDGYLRGEYTNDGIHLTLAGYLAWLEAIVPGDRAYQDAVRALAPRWLEEYPSSWPVDAVNPSDDSTFPGGRGSNQLVVYTPEYGKPTTGTNEWGVETTVIDGMIVTRVEGNDSRIPAEGYVLSAHGNAAAWLRAHAGPGQPVYLEEDRVHFPTHMIDNLYMEYWHAVAALVGRDAEEREFGEALRILKKLRKLDRSRGERAREMVGEIFEDLRGINPERYRVGWGDRVSH